MARACFLIPIAAALAAGPALAQAPTEASLRAIEAAHLEALRSGNAEAIAGMAHPNFRLFAPEGYIGDRDRLLARFKGREAGYDKFERQLDSVTITGDVGIVMGHETVVPSTDTATARRLGPNAGPVHRRFTNVWLWQGGKWLWLARDADEIKAAPATAAIPPKGQ